MERECKKCCVIKNLLDFPVLNKPSGQYYAHTCKECRNATRRKGTGKILFNDGTIKECGKCGIRKPHSEFAKKNGKPVSKCKKCHNLYYKKYYDSSLERKEKHRFRAKNGKLPRHQMHGLTDEAFEALKTSNGMCPLCNKRKQAVIDHDHKHCPGDTGCSECVRGYICSGCNTALGLVDDSIDKLEALIVYLKP